MTRIDFQFDEKITQTMAAHVDVPDDVIANGEDAVREYVREHESDWENDCLVENHYESDGVLMDTVRIRGKDGFVETGE